MTVAELREALAAMPGHWPVHVEIATDSSGAINGEGWDKGFHYTLDCTPSNFPTSGCMAVIRLNYEPS